MEPNARPDRWEFYQDDAQEWRWTRYAPNGEVVDNAHEGFTDRRDCEANAKRCGWFDDRDPLYLGLADVLHRHYSENPGTVPLDGVARYLVKCLEALANVQRLQRQQPRKF